MGCTPLYERRWHRKMERKYRRSLGAGPSRRLLVGVGLVLALTAAGTAIANATDGPGGTAASEQVGVCHATGAAHAPYIFLVVDGNGADLGHHREHPDDVVGVMDQTECPAGPLLAAEDEPTADQAIHPEACDAASPGSAAQEPLVEETAPAEGQPAPASEAQEAMPDAEFCPADVGVTQVGEIAQSRVYFRIEAFNHGPDEANNVTLESLLPDSGRAWRLENGSAEGCALEVRRLACSLGDLSPQEGRSLAVSSLRCQYDCGDDIENTVRVAAFNDPEPANDGATSVVEVADCPTAPGSVPASTSEQPPVGEAPEPASPAPGDAAVGQWASQTDSEAVLTLTVTSLGPANATGVVLRDRLPELWRSWYLGGADAQRCTLEARDLVCWFGTLSPGESRTVTVRAYTDRMPCGQHLSNTASVVGDNDANDDNDRSTASIAARAC